MTQADRPEAPAPGSTAAVQLSDEGPGVALLRIDNPPANSLSAPVRSALAEAVERLGDRVDEVRAVVVTGTDRRFCAGADIGELTGAVGRGRDVILGLVHEVQDLFSAIEDLPMPTIAAINGPAVGGGLELSLACDFRIAADDVPIGLSEVRLGLVPGAGGTQRLPRLLGQAKALDLILRGTLLRGAAAREAGLVTEVVDRDDVLSQALQLAGELAALPRVAVAAAKRAVRASWPPVNLAAEREAFAAAVASPDAAEGIAAFLEKRRPQFRHL
jgi:enoyl-CoA hydratase